MSAHNNKLNSEQFDILLFKEMKKREPTGISESALCVLTVNKESSSHAVAMETASVMTCGVDKLIVCFFSPVHTHFSPFLIFTF